MTPFCHRPTRFSVRPREWPGSRPRICSRRRENAIDPFVGQAGTSRIVDGDEIDVRPNMLPVRSQSNRTARLPPSTTSMPRIATLAANFDLKLAVLRIDDQDQLLDVVPVQKPFGGMQPDGPVGQRCKRLLVMLVTKPAALAGSRQNHTPRGHRLLCTVAGCPSHGTSRTRMRCRRDVRPVVHPNMRSQGRERRCPTAGVFPTIRSPPTPEISTGSRSGGVTTCQILRPGPRFRVVELQSSRSPPPPFSSRGTWRVPPRGADVCHE